MQKSISFNDQSIRLIRNGCKTQTRRPLAKVIEKYGPSLYDGIGAKLMVKEAFRLRYDNYLEYRADKPMDSKVIPPPAWKEPSEMTENESRLELTICAERVERVQEITEHGAIDEGVFWSDKHDGWVIDEDGSFLSESPRDTFQKWFVSIYGPEPWDTNDFVVVLEFKAEQTREKVNFFQEILSAKG